MLITIAIIVISITLIIISAHIRANTELRDALHFDEDIAPQLRISIIETHGENIGHIAAMLRSESTAYQVVVVFDFSSKENLLQRLIQYFGLIKVDYTPNGEITPMAISGLYRSHRRLFNRVVVVDSPSSSHYTALEVGAAVSSYNYCLQVKSRRTLRARAIENLLFELSSHSDPSLDEIRSAIGERFHLMPREAALHRYTQRKVETPSKNRIRIAYRILQ